MVSPTCHRGFSLLHDPRALSNTELERVFLYELLFPETQPKHSRNTAVCYCNAVVVRPLFLFLF